MTIDEIAALPVHRLAALDCHLWLWVTNVILKNGWHLEPLEQWGFTPKTILTWCKVTDRGTPKIGTGWYLRNATEHVIFATKGQGTALVLDKSLPTFFTAPRSIHSRKPTEAYDIMERLSLGPRAELFARVRRKGWVPWGPHAISQGRRLTLRDGKWGLLHE